MTEWKSSKYWRNRSAEERVRNTRVPARYRGKTLADFEVPPGDEKAYNALKVWRSKISEHFENGMGILLYGPTGVGKTHLAQALLVDVVKKNPLSGIFVTSDLFIDMSLDESRNKGELTEPYSDPQLLKYMRRVFDIVVLDGLGSERSTTEFARNSIVSLVESRYEEKLVTMVTTLLPPNEIGRTYGARFNSMLQESCFFIKVEGTDYRRVFDNAG
jgi:DNA replication protein DnaC